MRENSNLLTKVLLHLINQRRIRLPLCKNIYTNAVGHGHQMAFTFSETVK